MAKEYRDISIALLVAGEKVTCNECGKDIFKTKDCAPEKAHDFYCDHCGSHIHLIPNVIVE